MGIDIVGLEALLLFKRYVTNFSSALTLERQGMHISLENIHEICKKYNTDPSSYVWNNFIAKVYLSF